MDQKNDLLPFFSWRLNEDLKPFLMRFTLFPVPAFHIGCATGYYYQIASGSFHSGAPSGRRGRPLSDPFPCPPPSRPSLSHVSSPAPNACVYGLALHPVKSSSRSGPSHLALSVGAVGELSCSSYPTEIRFCLSAKIWCSLICIC